MAGKLSTAGFRICCVAALIAVPAIGTAGAQSTGASADGGGDATTRLGAVSVTATRNPIKAFEYPGMVSVTGPEEIRLQQPSSADDILKFVPGVEFTGGPRRTGESPSIRGFSGPDVVVLFDGTRQNFDSGHDGRFFIDPALLKQVEVLRGPASSLYGSGGTGGVIEFRTVDAADYLADGETAGVMAATGFHTVNREKQGTVSGFARPTENLDLVASLTRRGSGSIELGNDVELDQSNDDIVAGLAKASYRIGTDHRVEGSYIGFRNDAEEPSNGQGAGSTDIVEKEITSQTLRLGYSYENPADRLLDLDIVGYYTRNQDDETRQDNLGGGPAGELLKQDVDTIGLRVDNRSRFDHTDMIATTLTYGVEAYQDTQDGAAGAGERDGVPDARAEFYGVFAQAEVAIAEPFGGQSGDLLVIPGLRYDDYQATSALGNDNAASRLSPRVAVSYLPNDWLMGFASYSHAFRAPTFDELYLTGTHFQIPVGAGVVNRFRPNPDLAPQQTRTAEYGIGLTFDDVVATHDRFQVKGSRYVIWGKNFIDLSVSQPTVFVDCNPFIPGACDGTTNAANVPSAKLWGSEVEASYEERRFVLTAGYSKINGNNEDTGTYLGALAPEQFTLGAAWKIAEADSTLGWRVLYAREFDKVNTPADARERYALHDIYFSWQPAEGALAGFRVDLGIDNVFDESYTRVFTGAFEPGRDYKAQISYIATW